MAEEFTSYSVDNDRKFRDALTSAFKLTGDLRIPLRLIGLDFFKSRKAIFRLSGPGQYPDFGGFTPSAPVREGGPTRREAYKQRKRAKYGFDYPLLKATGTLEKSVTNPNDPKAVFRVTKDSVTMGSKVPYLAFHQSDQPRSVLPLRKVLFLGPESKEFADGDDGKGLMQRFTGYIEGYLAEVMKKSGLPEPK